VQAMSRRALAAGMILSVLALGLHARQPTAAPLPNAELKGGTQSGRFVRELYFYPPFSTESLQHLFDPDWIVKNATTNFPTVYAMSGLAISIYWSQLCPVERQCSGRGVHAGASSPSTVPCPDGARRMSEMGLVSRVTPVHTAVA
jgi:hypothetical protein